MKRNLFLIIPGLSFQELQYILETNDGILWMQREMVAGRIKELKSSYVNADSHNFLELISGKKWIDHQRKGLFCLSPTISPQIPILQGMNKFQAFNPSIIASSYAKLQLLKSGLANNSPFEFAFDKPLFGRYGGHDFAQFCQKIHLNHYPENAYEWITFAFFTADYMNKNQTNSNLIIECGEEIIQNHGWDNGEIKEFFQYLSQELQKFHADNWQIFIISPYSISEKGSPNVYFMQDFFDHAYLPEKVRVKILPFYQLKRQKNLLGGLMGVKVADKTEVDLIEALAFPHPAVMNIYSPEEFSLEFQQTNYGDEFDLLMTCRLGAVFSTCQNIFDASIYHQSYLAGGAIDNMDGVVACNRHSPPDGLILSNLMDWIDAIS